jgi:tRNA dimethylallyltransferase
MRSKVIAIVGPTGTGKSALALDVAEQLIANGQPAEIVNADAMQFYKGMNIGTAKLPLQERRGITHHLFDWLEITQESTAANYQPIAREKVTQIIERGAVPIVVGGSMLYLASLLNTFEFPGRDIELRAQLESRLSLVGSVALHAELAVLDSVAASRIDPLNGRRVVRALEIVQVTGQPFAASLPDKTESWLPVLEIGLNSERPHLVERLNSRVERMWQQGLLAEVESLLPLGLRQSKTASQAIGYAQALAQLDGEIDEADAIELTSRLTARYARRQMSWFRRDERIHWLDYQDQDLNRKAFELVGLAMQDHSLIETAQQLLGE